MLCAAACVPISCRVPSNHRHGAVRQGQRGMPAQYFLPFALKEGPATAPLRCYLEYQLVVPMAVLAAADFSLFRLVFSPGLTCAAGFVAVVCKIGRVILLALRFASQVTGLASGHALVCHNCLLLLGLHVHSIAVVRGPQ
jgi:hypothetical protein